MVPILLGMLLCFGVVGTLEIEPTPNMPVLAALLTLSLIAMASGVKQIQRIK